MPASSLAGGGGVMRTPHLLAGACATSDPEAPYRHAELAVWDEVQRCLLAYPRVWASLEEGAILLGEEVDELWDEVRCNRIGRARAEAVQVAAMGIRFVADLCSTSTGAPIRRCREAAAAARRLRPALNPTRPFASSHEAFGFLKREYDALWLAVTCGGDPRPAAERTAATAIRFVAEILSAERSLA